MNQQLTFDLRYRFDYWDGKPSKVGKWNHSGEHAANQAWCADKTGLAWVFIEAKNIETGQAKNVVECPGQDFRFLQWRALRGVHLKNVSTPSPTINIGLVLWTARTKIFVYRYGKIETEELTEHEQNYHYAAYGR